MTRDELLAELNRERERLRRATSIRGFLRVRRIAMWLRENAKADNLGMAFENAAFELQVLAEREVGIQLPRVFPHGGDRKSSTSRVRRSTLTDFGLTYRQSHQFRHLAQVQPANIVSYIAACTAAHKRASLGELLRLGQTTL